MNKIFYLLTILLLFAAHTTQAQAPLAQLNNSCNASNQSHCSEMSNLGCNYDCLTGSGDTARVALTYDYAMGSGPAQLMDYRHYGLAKNATNASNSFQGKLTLTTIANQSNIVEVGQNNNLPNYPQASYLPKFDFEFIQHGSHLIPVTRGLISTGHPNWEYILEPGRIWQESSDQGYSRASLPFALQERNANCTFNGVMSFLFKENGAISQVSYQIAAETCLYLKLNMWGRLDADYKPYAIKHASEIKKNYEHEIARRMPTKAISQLAVEHPQADVITANIGSNQQQQYQTLYGVAYNGIHYVGGCNTRYGLYPFCAVMAVPSYSTSKTTFGAYGLMRLEQLFSGSQKKLLVADWVAQCAKRRWRDVTLESLLNMATGNYHSSKFHHDESSLAKLTKFFLKDQHADLITYACSFPRKAKPGTTFVYHTSDTYILGTALNNYYQSKTSTKHDFWRDELVKNLWQPLGLSPTMYRTKRSYDNIAQPFTGYGLTYHSDDVVKLAELLNKDRGRINNVQVLDLDLVQQSLDISHHGLPAGRPVDKYHLGLWYYNIDADQSFDYGCASAKWVPYMSGYGGISIVLLPNNMIYYHFSDNNSFTWGKSAKELHKISPLC
ncbi:CubicO group peptidase, beta-lactamase class C family [Colwellia chukchiensis]|uniref:CubicO group peptidase, beta-lactamase class C family n=1 Tax=Colwellia chukchiensis TaxID=641665 RepID=A0A1H7SJM4_9GAMM|nr:serine hydrolase [Colwellia chukchiensis]SEL72316.1 CubicO group peptidase, beta-lactamase class C family [Colwellia chukchiensis]